MEKGVDFYYYKVDRTGKIIRFSVKGLKGMTPDEMVTYTFMGCNYCSDSG